MNQKHHRQSTEASTTSSRRRLLQGAAIAGTGLLAGCLGSASSAGRALTIGYQPYYAEAWSALIIKNGGLAAKHLPEGYSVKSWDSALQGSIVGTRLIAGKNQVGYTGDMPTITAIANDDTPVSAVGIAGFSKGQQCNLAVVPKESSIAKAAAMDGKDVAVTTGSCTHRFYLNVIEKIGINPQLIDNSIGNILAEIRQGSLPVGFGWEPNMARAVFQENEARYLLTGAQFDTADAAGIIMPDSFIEADREAAVGWLKAELEAKRIMATQPERTLDLVSQEGDLSTYERETLRAALYRTPQLGNNVSRLNLTTDYRTVPQVEQLLKQKGPKFLKEQGAISEVPASSRYQAELTKQAAEELGVTLGPGRFGGNTGNNTSTTTASAGDQA
ncbi:ABC transporter substrate-binding protein [Halococcus thailandensis]|uniref:Nitrate/sulfonate/bicarbonate ABC transporter periplasmic component-like protein n=1 Tax=Halococcus thailandensis JCM 13552 TaxID=1227457 RepID=M0N2X0_9EURY|nr:ABC transporter substrate-binding protein [Halococcus thailandensis]EMA51878.1 nitrate/sulfonate/bicarbonate ABC transporter periplasmic component-like protein [Halococcus thailandensis JCM 13552]